jgi:hypothetical protein
MSPNPTRLTRLSLLAGALVATSPAWSAPYRPKGLGDLRMTLTHDTYVPLELWMGVHATVSVQSDLDSRASQEARLFIDALIGASWEVVGRAMAEHDRWRVPCRGDAYNLNVFIIDGDLLFDRRRFTHVYNAPDIATEPGAYVYAFYDSTPEIDENSAIILGHGNSDSFAGTAVHELAHYWWDRMCLRDKLPGFTTETFAQRMESVFQKLYGG